MTTRIAVEPNDLQAYLRRYAAVFHKDVSTPRRHIYFSRPTGKWIKVKSANGKFYLTFHNECPCGGED